MKKTISKMLILCLALIALIPPGPSADAQAKSDASNAYGLGVNMGLASYQMSFGTYGHEYTLARDALMQAKDFAHQLKVSAPKLNVGGLDNLVSRLSPVAPQEEVETLPSEIVTKRGEYSGTLWQASKQMGNAYDLGVAIAIGEGQATAGEAARGIVRTALVSAQAPAANLGLSTKEITGIIAQIDQGVALNGIHNQINYLSGKYQSLLSALQPVIPGPRIATGQGAPVDADTVLLKRGCTRTGVGSYKCPTVGAYEACESYRLSGKSKVTACSTSANEKVQAAMEKTLFSVGCSRFLGRAEEFMCKTQKSFDLCETYRKSGTAKKCLLMK